MAVPAEYINRNDSRQHQQSSLPYQLLHFIVTVNMDFYYSPLSPPCRSVQLVAKALGLELNLKLVNMLEKEHLKPEFVKINPQHTIPTLVDNDFVIWESRAILVYLIEKYAKNDALYPKDPQGPLLSISVCTSTWELCTRHLRNITLRRSETCHRIRSN